MRANNGLTDLFLAFLAILTRVVGKAELLGIVEEGRGNIIELSGSAGSGES